MNAAVGALSAGAAGIAAQRHQRVRWYHATSALRVPFGAVQKTANLARQSANHPNCRWLQAPAQCSARSATRTGLLGAANPRVFYSLALLSLLSLALSSFLASRRLTACCAYGLQFFAVSDTEVAHAVAFYERREHGRSCARFFARALLLCSLLRSLFFYSHACCVLRSSDSAVAREEEQLAATQYFDDRQAVEDRKWRALLQSASRAMRSRSCAHSPSLFRAPARFGGNGGQRASSANHDTGGVGVDRAELERVPDCHEHRYARALARRFKSSRARTHSFSLALSLSQTISCPTIATATRSISSSSAVSIPSPAISARRSSIRSWTPSTTALPPSSTPVTCSHCAPSARRTTRTGRSRPG